MTDQKKTQLKLVPLSANNEELRFNTSPEICSQFTTLPIGSYASISGKHCNEFPNGCKVIIMGVAPTACGECESRPSCSTAIPRGTPVLWAKEVTTRKLFELTAQSTKELIPCDIPA